MIRNAAVLAIVLCISPPLLFAQGTTFRVSASSAEIHKAPSTGSPVLGAAPRGAALNVKRELGSWVSVAWPGALNDEAFVHVTRGSIARGGSPAGARAGEADDAATIAGDVGRVERAVLAERAAPQAPIRPSAPSTPVYATPTHTLGVGGVLGGYAPAGFGVSGRAWLWRLGVQANLSRYALESPVGPERLTSVQFEPSLLFSPADYVSESVWVRPYVGSGLSLRRQTIHAGLPGVNALSSQDAFGVQAFGGAELTAAGLPQFSLSADAGYRWTRTPLPGFDLRGMAFSVSGHWYVR